MTDALYFSLATDLVPNSPRYHNTIIILYYKKIIIICPSVYPSREVAGSCLDPEPQVGVSKWPSPMEKKIVCVNIMRVIAKISYAQAVCTSVLFLHPSPQTPRYGAITNPAQTTPTGPYIGRTLPMYIKEHRKCEPCDCV